MTTESQPLEQLLDEIDQYCANAKAARPDFDEVSWLPRLVTELREQMVETKALKELLDGLGTVAPKVLSDSIDRNKENVQLRAELRD